MQRFFANKKFDPEDSLELARGYFENISYHKGVLTISGWMIPIDEENDSLRLYLNTERFAESVPVIRQDVKKALANIDCTEYSGFFFNCDVSKTELEELQHISVVGCRAETEKNKIDTWFDKDIYATIEAPPKHLTQRVSNTEDAKFFLISGMKTFGEYWYTVRKHRDPATIKRMLDWGCGCGRVIGFFSKYTNISQIAGCDVDSEAIEWCKSNIESVEFSVIPFFPPTHYANNTFDLVVSFSVFTHLTAENQALWLQEIHRILAPGGIFLTTVHGKSAAKLSFPASKIDKLLKYGIYEDQHDNSLDGIAPKNYYRAVFQTKAYTCQEWARFYTILEYKERGALNHQDLVVMKKES